ncbi:MULTISPECIES: potassium channel family protein [Microbacterium]|jgi:voltage-gated potassium channel|uniref:potassium channel family protein n=1 Tax=Microbacterium TaxID=33882 RepID=UPI001D170BD0|nr:potassium channel family protein [Microbacterium testaceum]MCC4249801.1 potassium channel family protein [Microbacterium testaceum]
MYGQRLARWERAAQWPLVVAALVFLAAYAAQILAQPQGLVETIAEVLLRATWAIFLLDYVVRIIIAENRWRWFWRHLLDLAIVALPVFRPLRLMRFFTIIALVQRNTEAMLRGRVVVYMIGATALTVFVAALAVFDAERGGGGPIDSFGDAIWWSFETITTVGYGDYFPVTVTGRIVAVGLMIGGIALIGVVTATLASWIVERVSVEAEQVSVEAEQASVATETQVEAMRAEIAELKELLRGTRSP